MLLSSRRLHSRLQPFSAFRSSSSTSLLQTVRRKSSITNRPLHVFRNNGINHTISPIQHKYLFLPFSSSYSSTKTTPNKDLYSRIGLTPKATQAQIKEAYYKLSMKYHPDRNHGNKSAGQKFREITEAYSILGNNLMRRKYDRGLLREYPTPSVTKAPPTSFSSTNVNNTAPKYNFDAFYQAHYGEALKREQKAKARRAQDKETKVQALTETQQRLLMISVVMLVFLFGWHYSLGRYGKELKKQTLMKQK